MNSTRVIYDTSAILSSMTPAPNRGSIVWHWMESGLVQTIVSDYLIDELVAKLAEPRFRLRPEEQASIITEYLQHTLAFDQVPQSGAHCRDPEDIPILDLAIWQQVDAIITTDPDLLELDGEFTFRIINPAGFQQLLDSNRR